MADICFCLILLASFIFQYGKTVPIYEREMATTANESTNGGFCEVSVSEAEMEEALSKTQQFLTDQMDIISLSLTNASSMIPTTYKPRTGEYLFFRYAIVNKKGQAILQFPNYADFLSSSILSAYKVSISANLVLSSTCNLTEKQFRAQVSQIALNIFQNSSYTAICRYQLDQRSNSESLFWWLIPAFTWDLFPTECVDKDKNYFILGNSPIVYIIYAIGVLICAYIPLFAFVLPNVSEEAYTTYTPGDQPFSIKRLSINIFHMKPPPPRVQMILAKNRDQHRSYFSGVWVKKFHLHALLQMFFTPTGRIGLLFVCLMNSVTVLKQYLHQKFDTAEAELNTEVGYKSNLPLYLVLPISVLFLYFVLVLFCFYSEALFDQNSILLLDVYKGVARVDLTVSLSASGTEGKSVRKRQLERICRAQSRAREGQEWHWEEEEGEVGSVSGTHTPSVEKKFEQSPWEKVSTAMLKAMGYCFTPTFWKLVACNPFRKVFAKEISGRKSTFKTIGLVIVGLFLVPFNFIFHAVSTFFPILKFPIFGTMDIAFQLQKHGFRCILIIVVCIWHIFMFCYYIVLARQILFIPFLLIIEFISYTLFVGVPFYPEYAVPRVALVLALIGYLLKFWYNFQSGYTHILQSALKAIKELENEDSITVVRFNKICSKVYPFYLSFGLFCGKVLLTALFLSLAMISLYESGSFKKYARFGELLSAVLFVFAPGFIDSFFQKDKAIWEHKIEVLVKEEIKAKDTLRDVNKDALFCEWKRDANKDPLFCEWECCNFGRCSGDCVLFCCPCSIKIPLCQQHGLKYVYIDKEPCGCNTNFIRCSRYMYEEIDEAKSLTNSTSRNTAINETTPILSGNKSIQEL